MSQTWDGKSIAAEPPYGATVVVYRVSGSRREFLLLHRAQLGPDYVGDWAWTPPAGARVPGEVIEACARRELHEEAGLSASLRRIDDTHGDWAIFLADADTQAIVPHDAEHDRFEWVSLDEALKRCRPERAAVGFEMARSQIE